MDLSFEFNEIFGITWVLLIDTWITAREMIYTVIIMKLLCLLKVKPNKARKIFGIKLQFVTSK